MPDDQNREAEQTKGQLAQMVEGIDEKKWRVYQTIGGVALGAAAGAFMFLVKDDGSILPINFIVALALVKFVPDYLEKQMSRSLGRARVAMIIMMVISILSYAAYILLTKGLGAFTGNS